MPHTQLLVFAKYPEPGSVMTRLSPSIPPERAADIQRACIRLLCERAFRCWPVRPLLMITPDDSADQFRDVVGPFVRMRSQGTGSLGDRLERAIGRAIDEGERAVLVIGSDSPTLPDAMIQQAIDRLADHDAVIGPCRDGGFYLIGVRRFQEGMLDGVMWSSDQAAVQVVRRLERLGWQLAVLDEWYDIDHIEDVKRAAEDLRLQDRRDDFELRKAMDEALASVGGGGGSGAGVSGGSTSCKSGSGAKKPSASSSTGPPSKARKPSGKTIKASSKGATKAARGAKKTKRSSTRV